MQTKNQYSAASGVYQRQLGTGGFLGVDFSSAPYQTDTRHLADCVNLWHDYGAEQGGFLETFPGFRCITNLNAPIFGLFLFQPTGAPLPFLIIHAGDKLYALTAVKGVTTVTPTLIAAGLAQNQTTAFVSQGQMGILDGTTFHLLSYDSQSQTFSLVPAYNLYTPITYADSHAYEQRNALSDRFMELWHLPYTEGFGEGEMGNLLFEVSSIAQKTCRLVGIKTPSTVVRVPAMAHIDGQAYRVTEVGERAFQNNNIMEVLVVEEGVESIGRYAVNTCLSLFSVSLPSSLVSIGKAAFAYCEQLCRVHFGEGISSVGDHAFYRCPGLSHISYGGTSAEWATLSVGTGNEPLTALTPVYETATDIHARCYSVTVHEKCREVLNVKLGEVPVADMEYFLTGDSYFAPNKTYYTPLGNRYVRASVAEGESVFPNTYYEKRNIWYKAEAEEAEGEQLITRLYIYADDGRVLPQSRLTLEGRLSATQYAPTDLSNFGSISPVDTKSAIFTCTLSATFDGRVFLTGTPAMPNTLFYSQRTRTGHNHPAYFGICNYVEDGTANVPFTAMTATPTSLFVYKGENAAEGVVYCHTPESTDSPLLPRIYPATAGVVGGGCVGAACNFADDTVFLSKRGLEATDKSTLSAERGLSHRSYYVDTRLCEEDLAHTKITEWQGYLLLLCPNGHVYMADSRLICRHKTGELGYEWVYLAGVGGYLNDLPVYRYATAYPQNALSCTSAEGDILLSPCGDSLPFDSYENYESSYSHHVHSAELTFIKGTGDVFTIMGHYASVETPDGVCRYLLYPTEERTGGRLSPATVGCSVGDLLYLGTAEGHLLLANTDLRGIAYGDFPPPSPNGIDRHHYHICHHRVTSYGVTPADNGDCPTMTKTTEKRSTVVQTKSLSGGRVTVLVATDKESFHPIGTYTEGALSFEDLDLFSLSFTNRSMGQAVLRENTKRWSYKQYALVSEDYQRPFGIGQLSYRYRVEGRIKPL